MRKNHLIYVIFLLTVYLPFEDFILKWLPVSEQVFLALRQLPDAIILTLVLLLALSALLERKVYAFSIKSFLLFVFFIAFAFVSIALNNPSIIQSLLSLKALIRYMFLLNILYYCLPTDKQFAQLFMMITFIAVMEATIGIIQYVGEETVRNLFKPREISGESGIVFTALRKKSEDVFGTMAYTINYAAFLLVAFVLLAVCGKHFIKNRWLIYGGGFYIMVAIFLSGSRVAFLGAFIAIALYLSYTQRGRLLAYTLPGFLVVMYMVLFLDKGATNQDFWYFMSPQYLDMIEHQRLGMIRVFIQYASNLDQHLLYGLSPDKNAFMDYILQHYTLPYFFGSLTLRMIEDVYWVALTFYYGIPGVALFIASIYFLYKCVKQYERSGNIKPVHRDMVLVCRILLLLLIPLNFVNQFFAIRQFAFYLWVIIGFTLSVLMQQQEAKH